MPVQTTDFHMTSADTAAITSSTDGEMFTVVAGVSVAADDGQAYDLVNNNVGLINHGSLSAATEGNLFYPGVEADSSGCLVVNASDGSITGPDGIILGAANDAATNFGAIWATNVGELFQIETQTASFDNRGFVYSATAGVYDFSSSGGNVVTNSGTIDGQVEGVVIDLNAPGLFTTIINSGTIRSAKAAINQGAGLQGGLHLTNTGTLIGGISMGGIGDHDQVTNSGHINGPINLGGGNDTFNGAGGTQGAIDGGLGKDTLTGGSGKDTFVFDTALGASNVDHITNFKPGTDKIELSHAIFTQINASRNLSAAMFSGNGTETASTRIFYNPTNGHLNYDVDGAGGAAPRQFALLAEHLTLHNTDFLILAA